MRRHGHLDARTATRLALAFAALSACATLARAQAEEGPAGVALVVDTSDSMRDAAGKRVHAALRRLLESGDARDEYFVFGVSTDVNVELSGAGAGLDAAGASKALGRLFSKKKQGATALYDACALAATRLANGRHPRRLILVISDGLDTVSATSLADVQNLLKRLGVRLVAVGIPSGDLRRVGGAVGVEALDRLAAASGGSVYRMEKDAKEDAIHEGIKALLAPAGSTRK